MKQSTVRKRRPGVRRGRVIDKEYMAWAHQQAGIMYGGRCATLHHVRLCGSPKDDRRTVPMEWGYHQLQEGGLSIEALGKVQFQAMHGIDLEKEIQRLQTRYLIEHPDVKW